MKKLFSLALGVTLVLGLGACGNKKDGKKFDDKILAAEEGTSFFLTNGNYGSWGVDEECEMTATSVAKVAEKDEALAEKLSKKSLKYLYAMDNVEFGITAAGYTKKFKAADGRIMEADGSYTFKVIRSTYDEEVGKYAGGDWLPDPHKAHAESIDGNMFIPAWQEEADEDGFSWADDSVVNAGAGKYTVVIAQYTTTSSATEAGYGFGLIKTEASEANPYTEYVAPTDLTIDQVSLIGHFEGHNWDYDAQFTKGSGNTWTLEGITLAVDDEIKVRTNNSWDEPNPNFGAESLDAASASFSSTTTGNMKVTVEGTYNFSIVITVEGTTATGTLTVTAA